MVLIGPSGCGKSPFARKHFKRTEVMSSDAFRALVSDDENDQSSTDDAFAALHFVAARRLARAKLTVVDATNVQPEARKPLVALAREYHVLPVAAMLAAAQQTKRSPETGDLLVPIQLVAGARNPLNFGVLLDRGLRRPQFRRRSDILPRDA